MEEYDVHDDLACNKCETSPVHSRSCQNLHCFLGEVDESEFDPINFMPGELLTECPDCKGTETEWWCPTCGEDLYIDKLITL